MNFVGKRKIWYIISLLIIIPGIISMMLQGLNFGIDFIGGTIMQVKFDNEVTIEELRAELNVYDLGSSKIQHMDDGSYQIKTVELEQAKQDEVIGHLENNLGDLTILRSELVGPTIGKELKRAGIISLTVAILLIMAYITFRFEFQFAITADRKSVV